MSRGPTEPVEQQDIDRVVSMLETIRDLLRKIEQHLFEQLHPLKAGPR